MNFSIPALKSKTYPLSIQHLHWISSFTDISWYLYAWSGRTPHSAFNLMVCRGLLSGLPFFAWSFLLPALSCPLIWLDLFSFHSPAPPAAHSPAHLPADLLAPISFGVRRLSRFLRPPVLWRSGGSPPFFLPVNLSLSQLAFSFSVRCSSPDAGGSFGSCGTSSPRKAFASIDRVSLST